MSKYVSVIGKVNLKTDVIEKFLENVEELNFGN